MSLREGNDDAATFRTRIPLPTRKPASALAAATANVVTATTTRATAGDVKSALAAATRPSRADKENDAAATARGRAASRGLGVSGSSETLKTAPNGTNASSSSRTTVPTVLTHRASDGVTSAPIPADAASSAGVLSAGDTDDGVGIEMSNPAEGAAPEPAVTGQRRRSEKQLVTVWGEQEKKGEPVAATHL